MSSFIAIFLIYVAKIHIISESPKLFCRKYDYRIYDNCNLCNLVIITHYLQIYNHKERGDPTGDAELDEVVFDEALRGGAAEAEDDHVLEIA